MPEEMSEVAYAGPDKREAVSEEFDPELIDVKRLIETFQSGEFTGVITLTNELNHACLTLKNGEVAGFWYNGKHDVNTIDEFLDTDIGENLEIHVFQRESPVQGEEVDKEVINPDYDEIVSTISDAFSGLTGRDSFLETLSNKFEEENLKGVHLKDERIIIDNHNDYPDVYDHKSEYIYHILYEAIEEESTMTPISTILQKIEEPMEDIDGGDDFLDMAVFV